MSNPPIPDALQRKLDTLPEGPGCVPLEGRRRGGSLRRKGQAAAEPGAKLFRDRLRGQPEESAAAAPDRRRRDDRGAERGPVADPREQPDQGVPAPLQRPAQGRQELPVDRGHPGRAVPPGPRHPEPQYPWGPLLRPLHRRGTAPPHARASSAASTRCAAVTTICPRERRERPCLDYHIGKCLAPCVGWQDEESYRRMVNDVVQFLEGKTQDLRSEGA